MSSIIKGGPSLSKLAFWVDWKMADIISPLPGCSKRKSGKSVSVEEQRIILNVAKYFKKRVKGGNKPQFRAGAGANRYHYNFSSMCVSKAWRLVSGKILGVSQKCGF